jgi:hypothetical protein
MSIHDREYMKRRQNDDDDEPSDASAEDAVNAMLQWNRKLLIWGGLVLLGLAVVGVAIGLFSRP